MKSSTLLWTSAVVIPHACAPGENSCGPFGTDKAAPRTVKLPKVTNRNWTTGVKSGEPGPEYTFTVVVHASGPVHIARIALG